MPGIKCVVKCPYTEIRPKVLQLSACWAETNKQTKNATQSYSKV